MNNATLPVLLIASLFSSLAADELLTLTNNTRYWRKVFACNDGGCSGPSEKGSFFIAFPTAIASPDGCRLRTLTSC